MLSLELMGHCDAREIAAPVRYLLSIVICCLAARGRRGYWLFCRSKQFIDLFFVCGGAQMCMWRLPNKELINRDPNNMADHRHHQRLLMT